MTPYSGMPYAWLWWTAMACGATGMLLCAFVAVSSFRRQRGTRPWEGNSIPHYKRGGRR